MFIGSNMNGEKFRLSKDTTNNHCGIFGIPGIGKSTWMIKKMTELAKSGKTVVAFNWRNSLNPNMMKPEIAKEYLTYRKQIKASEGIPLPLFEKFDTRETNVEIANRAISALKKPARLTENESKLVKKAFMDIMENGRYKKSGYMAICEWLYSQDQARYEKAAVKIEDVLQYLVPGNFLLNNKGKILEIDLSLIEYDEQTKVVTFIVDFLYRLAQKSYFKGNHVWIMIDEAQNLEWTPGNVAHTIMDEGRKLDFNFFTCAPSMSKKGMEVILSAGLGIFFRPSEADKERIATTVNESEKETIKFLLSTLEKDEFLAKGKFSKDSSNEDFEGYASLKLEIGGKNNER